MALITVNGVSANVYLGPEGDAGGIEESWGEGQPARVTVHYRVAWSDRYAFITGLRGGIVGGVVFLPHTYPPSPNLTCVGIGQIRGVKPRVAGGFLEYQDAIIPAEYGVPVFDVAASSGGTSHADPSGKAFTSTDWQVTVEVFQPPTGVYFWQGGPASGQPIPDASIGLVRPRVEFTIRRSWLPYPPLDFFMRYSGSVNDAPVRISDYTFPRGTLLLPGAQGGMSRDGSLEGRTGELVYTLVGNGPVNVGGVAYVPSWNEFFATNGTWQEANTAADGSGEPPYRYSDFWGNLP